MLPIIYIWCMCTEWFGFQSFRQTHSEARKNLQIPEVIQFDSHFAFFADVEIVFVFFHILGLVIDFQFAESLSLKDCIYVISLDIPVWICYGRRRQSSIGFYFENMYLILRTESYVNRAHSWGAQENVSEWITRSREKISSWQSKWKHSERPSLYPYKTATCDVR